VGGGPQHRGCTNIVDATDIRQNQEGNHTRPPSGLSAGWPAGALGGRGWAGPGQACPCRACPRAPRLGAAVGHVLAASGGELLPADVMALCYVI